MNDLIKENIIKKKDKFFLEKNKIIIPKNANIKVKDGSITFTVDEKQDKVVINFRDDEIILTEKKRGGGYRGGGTKDLTFTLQDIFEAWKFQTKTSVHVGIEKPQKSCWKIKHNDDGKIYAKFINNGCTINGGGKRKSRRKRRMSKRNLRKKKRKSKRNLRKNKKKSKKIMR